MCVRVRVCLWPAYINFVDSLMMITTIVTTTIDDDDDDDDDDNDDDVFNACGGCDVHWSNMLS